MGRLEGVGSRSGTSPAFGDPLESVHPCNYALISEDRLGRAWGGGSLMEQLLSAALEQTETRCGHP